MTLILLALYTAAMLHLGWKARGAQDRRARGAAQPAPPVGPFGNAEVGKVAPAPGSPSERLSRRRSIGWPPDRGHGEGRQ